LKYITELKLSVPEYFIGDFTSHSYKTYAVAYLCCGS